LKAKFCREGNAELRKIAKKYSIPIRDVGKVVVARNDEENLRLEKLFERGLQNGVDLELLDEQSLKQFEPLAQTTSRFLWSPTTAVSDSGMMINALRKEFERLGGSVVLAERIDLVEVSGMIHESNKTYDAKFIVNAAGAQADRISRNVNVGLEYAMLPFMGVYRATNQSQLPLQRLVYPVPHPINPFLGVHFTLTINGLVKIGPTAIPVFGREQYAFNTGWSISDSIQALKGATALIKGESHNFGAILKSEWPKVILKKLIKESTELVPSAHSVDRWNKKPPGIRAQLVHLPTGKLEQDFVAKKYLNSVHVLNAVSPGWTSAIPFGKWIVDEYING
jgi:L-2-hydroxyglutarate oxidase LhgO